MKKSKIIITAFFTSVMLTACADSAPGKVEIANPWIETDSKGVLEATGFDVTAPEDATDVVYSYMESTGTAQVKYVQNGHDWNYRVQATDGLSDISGMYYEWVVQEPCSINGFEGMSLAYSDATEDTQYIDDVFAAHVVYWYDSEEGATHSLSVAGKDIDGLDIEVVAENLK